MKEEKTEETHFVDFVICFLATENRRANADRQGVFA